MWCSWMEPAGLKIRGSGPEGSVRDSTPFLASIHFVLQHGQVFFLTGPQILPSPLLLRGVP